MRFRRRVAFATTLALIGTLFGGPVSADHAAPTNAWPVSGGDAANRGVTTATGPVQPTPVWAETFEDYRIGGIIGGTRGDRARVVTDNDGNLLLRVLLNNDHPSRTDDFTDHTLVSLDRTDGSVRWEALKTTGRSSITCVPAVAPDGTIYTVNESQVTEPNARLVALDPDTGTQIGPGITVRRGCEGSLQFTHDGLLLYTEQITSAFDNTALRAFSVSDGLIAQVWARANTRPGSGGATADDPLQRESQRPVMADDGTTAEGGIYWVERRTLVDDTSELVLHRLDAATGASITSVVVPGDVLNSVHADPAGGVIISTGNSGSGLDIVGHLYRYLDSGTALTLDWSYDLDLNNDGNRPRARVSDYLVIAGDNLVGWSGDVIFAIDYESGAYMWEFAPDGSGGFSAALGMVAADAAGNVYYETVGEELIGSIDANGSPRGTLASTSIERRFNHFAFTAAGELYAISGGDTVGVALLEEGIDLAACLAQYSDVSADQTHAGAICSVSLAQIAGGFADGTFRPGDPVTRGQMATFIARATFPDETFAPGTTFSDVPVTNTHAGAIQKLVDENIIGGFADGTFRPGDPVTRAQTSTFIGRTSGLEFPAYNGEALPSDVLEGDVHTPAIQLLVEAEIVGGFADGTFRPGDPVTRGQMSTFIDRSRQQGIIGDEAVNNS